MVVVRVAVAAAIARRPRSVEVTNAAATGPSEPTTPAVELTGPAPTAADLDGIWTLEDSSHLLRFAAADGTFAIDDSGALIDGLEDAGTFSLSGNTLTLVAAGSAKCEDGQRAVWQVELLGDGRLHAIATLDECGYPLAGGRGFGCRLTAGSRRRGRRDRHRPRRLRMWR